MKAIILSVLLATTSLTALAAEPPQASSEDGLVCTKIYNPNDVTVIHLVRWRQTTIQFAETEVIERVSTSDTINLQTSVFEGKNLIWFKPTLPLSPQPVTIVTRREDGTLRVYLQQVDARLPETDVPVQTASTNAASAMVSDVFKPCYLVRYVYPEDEKAKAAEKAEAARKEAAGRWRAARDAATIRQTTLRNQNFAYVGQGNRDLVPDRIFDDGYSTFLQFNGNRPVPAAFEVDGTDKDRLFSGFNSEEGGCPGSTTQSATCLKIHAVVRQIRLRDREDLAGETPSLRIINRRFDAIGDRPGTGTSNPVARREVTK